MKKLKELQDHFDNVPNSLSSSLAEWGQSVAILDAYRQGVNTLVKEVSWMLPIGTDMNMFLSNFEGLRFNSINERYSLVYFPWGFGYITSQNFKLTINASGPEAEIDAFYALVDAKYERLQTESTIEWYYAGPGGRNQSISIKLNYKKAFDSFYPYLKSPETGERVGLKEYFTEYMHSDSTVLVLIGPPGTGKTSLIKNMLHDTKSSAIVTYDKTLLATDGLFVSFVSDDSTNFLIAEDADGFLGERRDGNDFMFKFLNVSDGLVSSAHKKIVFSTNLPSVAQIDPALLRKGRCFDVINFRPLDRTEATKACADLGRELTMDGQEFTLTEIFNGKDQEKQSSMGFGI